MRLGSALVTGRVPLRPQENYQLPQLQFLTAVPVQRVAATSGVKTDCSHFRSIVRVHVEDYRSARGKLAPGPRLSFASHRRIGSRPESKMHQEFLRPRSQARRYVSKRAQESAHVSYAAMSEFKRGDGGCLLRPRRNRADWLCPSHPAEESFCFRQRAARKRSLSDNPHESQFSNRSGQIGASTILAPRRAVPSGRLRHPVAVRNR